MSNFYHLIVFTSFPPKKKPSMFKYHDFYYQYWHPSNYLDTLHVRIKYEL
jgi:hypothetical protein